MDLTRARTIATGVALVVVASLGWTTPAGATDTAARCAALAGVEIPARVIGLPTTGGEVTDATLVAPSGSGTTAIGEYCRVSAALHPVDTAAPDIRMQVALPTSRPMLSAPRCKPAPVAVASIEVPAGSRIVTRSI